MRAPRAALAAVLTVSALLGAPEISRAQPAPAPRPSPSPQPRPHAARVSVDPALVRVDDGDTVVIRWSASDAEQVRILGIDTPETRHVEHDLPYDQPFGREAEAFARGAFAAARAIELRRSATLDPFGRTLGYLWIDGRNYSVMVVSARLAEESVTRYGDNGLPQEAAEVLAAARGAGPLPFESPATFRARMRDVSRWMKERGSYPPP
jgi:endonuclease YncB( thermonuclease family)